MVAVRWWLIGLLGTTLAVLLVGVAVGPAAIPFDRTFGLLTGWVRVPEADAWQAVVVWRIRLPRVLLAFLVGGALGIGGAVLQGVFRNPMADPGVLGVMSGACLGAVVALFLGAGQTSQLGLTLSAMAGAVATVLLVLALARAAARPSIATLLLIGIAVASLASSATSLLLSLSLDRYEVARQMVFWMLGGLDARTWLHVGMVAPIALVGAVILTGYARGLDAAQLGDDVANSLGVDIARLRIEVLVLSSVVVAAAVATSGSLPFVGLVVPHIARGLVGPGHTRLIPVSFWIGGLLVVLADLLARSVSGPVELRLGVVTSLLGGPFFLYLLLVPSPRGVGMVILEAKGLDFAFGSTSILESIDLTIPAGRVVALVGRNGSGKSTLLRLLAGLLSPKGGRIVLDGQPMDRLSRNQRARRLAYLPQEPLLPHAFTVREVVRLGRLPWTTLLHALDPQGIEIVDQAMAAAEVAPLADRSVSELSGGERRRVELARVFAQRARLLLLDEPTNNLDLHHALRMLNLLRAWRQEGTSAAVVLHDINLAARIADWVVVLDQGKVIEQGPPESVLTTKLIAEVFRVEVECRNGAFLPLRPLPEERFQRN